MIYMIYIMDKSPHATTILLGLKNIFFTLKKKGWKKILPMSTIILALIVLPIILFLVGKNQDNRQKAAESPNTKHPKVLVISYYPRDSQNSENLDSSATGETITVAQKQEYVNSLVSQLITNLSDATSFHKYKNPNASNYLAYSVYDTKNIYEKIPQGYLLDSAQGIYRPNYGAILTNQNICDLVNNHNISEVWMFGYHHADIEPDESRMSSKYGDISNSLPKETDPNYQTAYRMPTCNKSYVLYNYNYARTALEMTHNRIHQIENVMHYIDKKLFWGDFSEYVQATGMCVGALQADPDRPCHEPPHDYKSSCGNAHYTPNWKTISDEYNYTSQNNAENNCETWNPDDYKTTYVSANCNQWGCTELGFYEWFMQNMPGYNNCITYQGQNMRNWWDAMYDFNAFIDKGKNLYSSEQNCNLPEPSISIVTPTLTPTPSNTSIPSPTRIPTLTTTTPSNQAVLSVSLALPGIGKKQANNDDNPNPITPNRIAFVNIHNTNNLKVKNVLIPVSFDDNTFSFNGQLPIGNDIPTGNYTVESRLDGTLYKKYPDSIHIENGTISTLPMLTLVSGDIDQNNSLDITDYNMLIACYKKQPACKLDVFKSLSDLNSNGAVDIVDIQILLRGFSLH